jgi:FxsC-like protein
MALVFISYSRDDRDPYLERFLHDLRSELSAKTRDSGESVCYWDNDAVGVGQDWGSETADALKTSRMLLAICSPSYYNSTRCGRECQVFLERKRLADEKLRKPVRAIVPVFWRPPRGDLAERFSAFSIGDGLPEVYAAEGLRYLMRLTRFKNDYSQFIHGLADQLISAASDSVLPPYAQKLAELPTPVQPSPFTAGIGKSGDGPNTVNFVYVAASRSDLAPFRKSLEFYGASAWDWRPFNEPIGALAQAAASRLNLRYAELAADDSLTKNLLSAGSHREPVLSLVDIWTLRIDAFAERMREYDVLNLTNCGLILPWNDDDGETVAHRQELDRVLLQTLPRRIGNRSPAHDWTSVHSPAQLVAAMERTLTVLRMQIINDTAARRRIENPELYLRAQELGLSVDSLPSIQGPGGVKE